MCKQQCVIWDNVDISALHRRTALKGATFKYTNGSLRLWTLSCESKCRCKTVHCLGRLRFYNKNNCAAFMVQHAIKNKTD